MIDQHVHGDCAHGALDYVRDEGRPVLRGEFDLQYGILFAETLTKDIIDNVMPSKYLLKQ